MNFITKNTVKNKKHYCSKVTSKLDLNKNITNNYSKNIENKNFNLKNYSQNCLNFYKEESSRVMKSINNINNNNKNKKEQFYHNLLPNLSSLYLLGTIKKEQFFAGCKYQLIRSNVISYFNPMKGFNFQKQKIKTHSHKVHENIEKSIATYNEIQKILYNYEVDKVIHDYLDFNIGPHLLHWQMYLLKESLNILIDYFKEH